MEKRERGERRPYATISARRTRVDGRVRHPRSLARSGRRRTYAKVAGRLRRSGEGLLCAVAPRCAGDLLSLERLFCSAEINSPNGRKIRDVTNVAIPARGAPGAEGATGQISTKPLTIRFVQHLKSNGAKTSNQRDADGYAVAISKEYSKSV